MCRTAGIWDGHRGEWGASRVAKGISGWVYLYDGNSGPYLLPRIIIPFFHGLFATPRYPFCQLSRLSPSSSNFSLPFHHKSNKVIVSPLFPHVLGAS